MDNLNGWTREDEVIKRTFIFENFKEALSFFNQVAEIAEEENHHPDMCIHDWKKVTLTLTSHSAGGLTSKDFEVADKINQLY